MPSSTETSRGCRIIITEALNEACSSNDLLDKVGTWIGSCAFISRESSNANCGLTYSRIFWVINWNAAACSCADIGLVITGPGGKDEAAGGETDGAEGNDDETEGAPGGTGAGEPLSPSAILEQKTALNKLV